MQYNLKGTHIDLTQEIRAYIEKKLEGTDVLLRDPGAVRVDIELEYRASEEKMYRAEFTLHNHAGLRIEAFGGTLHEAIDKATSDLFIDLSRFRKKRRSLWRRGAVKVKEFVRGWRTRL